MEKLGNLITQATAPVRAYQKKKNQTKFKPQFARFKCKVWFTDGNAAPFYSYDWQEYTLKDHTKIKQHSEVIALKKLIQMLYKWLSPNKEGIIKAKTFEIYIDIDGKTLTDYTQPNAANYNYVIARGSVGSMREHLLLRFNDEGNLILKMLQDSADLKQLEDAETKKLFTGSKLNYAPNASPK